MLGEATDVVPQRLIGLLLAPLEIPGVPRVHVRALEVFHENLDQISPVVDLVGRKMFEPGACRVCEMQGIVANDDRVIIRATQLACQAVVVEPERGVCLSRVFDEGSGLSKARGKGSSANLPAEHTGARRLR